MFFYNIKNVWMHLHRGFSKINGIYKGCHQKIDFINFVWNDDIIVLFNVVLFTDSENERILAIRLFVLEIFFLILLHAFYTNVYDKDGSQMFFVLYVILLNLITKEF